MQNPETSDARQLGCFPTVISFPRKRLGAIHRSLRALLLAWLLSGSVSHAGIHLASPFTSHMVLQADARVPVWGTAAPGETVTVEFAGQKTSGVADVNGKWQVELKAMPPCSEPRELVVHGSAATPGEAAQCEDVLVGEVWLASGQSNMDFTLSQKIKRFAGVTNEEQEIAAARYPLIRMFTGTAAKAYSSQNQVGGEWLVCSPETAPAFSAVGYFFARALQREIKVPVGILTLAYGASTAESWIRREALKQDSQLQPLLELFDAKVELFRTNPPPAVGPPRSADATITNFPAGKSRRSTAPRDPVQDQHNPTVLYNGMIHPVIPYAIRGVIWYQGESIVGGAAGRKLYPRVQAALVNDWRKLWCEGDLPFYIVQLAGQAAESNSPLVREAQATVLALPNTGMAVTADIGERKNVHPKNKQDVGDRLARIALARVYGRKLEYSGPVFASLQTEVHRIRVNFSHAEGLVAKDGALKWFTIAGADGKFFPAEARIDGTAVVLAHPEVPNPVAVRYAWVNFPEGGHLYNAAGLPAVPFRTDSPALAE